MITPRSDTTCVPVNILIRLGTSKTERLEVYDDGHPSRDPLYKIPSMKNLCSPPPPGSHWQNACALVHALNPNTILPNVLVCPRLEELILVLRDNGMESYPECVIEMARTRTSRGAKLGTIRIVGGRNKRDPRDELKLREYVLHLKYDPEADGVSGDSDEEWKRAPRASDTHLVVILFSFLHAVQYSMLFRCDSLARNGCVPADVPAIR